VAYGRSNPLAPFIGAFRSRAGLLPFEIELDRWTTASLAIFCGFSAHCSSQSSSDGTVTSACFD
jgi:hypothetical protein